MKNIIMDNADPANRYIAATPLINDVALIASDRRIIESKR